MRGCFSLGVRRLASNRNAIFDEFDRRLEHPPLTPSARLRFYSRLKEAIRAAVYGADVSLQRLTSQIQLALEISAPGYPREVGQRQVAQVVSRMGSQPGRLREALEDLAAEARQASG